MAEARRKSPLQAAVRPRSGRSVTMNPVFGQRVVCGQPFSPGIALAADAGGQRVGRRALSRSPAADRRQARDSRARRQCEAVHSRIPSYPRNLTGILIVTSGEESRPNSSGFLTSKPDQRIRAVVLYIDLLCQRLTTIERVNRSRFQEYVLQLFG